MSNDTNKSKQLDDIRTTLKSSRCTYAIMPFQRIIACYTTLCMFDNVRDKLLEILKDSPTHGEFFDPQFLHKSVIIPCYLIGAYVAKMVPFDENMKKTARKNYLPKRKKLEYSVTLLFTNLYAVEYLKFLLNMTDKTMKTLNFSAFLPKPDAEQVG